MLAAMNSCFGLTRSYQHGIKLLPTTKKIKSITFVGCSWKDNFTRRPIYRNLGGWGMREGRKYRHFECSFGFSMLPAFNISS